MIFNEHSNLEGKHAFLSASSYHWLNYDLDKLEETYKNEKAKEYGTRLHEFASEAIKLGKMLFDNKSTLSLFVNDAIAYKMDSERVLYYSDNCFGTADAICFRRNLLRIHDLKTGTTKASEKQLMIYAALFCLEYKYKPKDIKFELRIYQSNTVRIYTPAPEEIYDIMKTIVAFDKHIKKIQSEGFEI